MSDESGPKINTCGTEKGKSVQELKEIPTLVLCFLTFI